MTAGVVVLTLAVLALWWRPRPDAVAHPVASARIAAPKADATKPLIATPQLDSDALGRRVRDAGASQDAAWQHLLTLWQATGNIDARTAARCPPMVAPGLYCLRSRAQLDRLATQGRPVLLRLRASGHEAWAVLVGADSVSVRLWLGGAALDVDRIALGRAWSGEYAALWRAPSSLAHPLLVDARGPSVEWVRTQLTPRYMAAGSPAVLDRAMQEAVRRFQAERGLLSDGVVGPETLLALAAINDNGPRLLRVLE